MPSSREYMQRYYAQNKKKILENRRDRYQNDPLYREKVKGRATVRAAIRSMATKAKKKHVEHAGRVERAFYLIEMEGLVNRAHDVLYSWRRMGDKVIPEPSYRDGRGRGLYAESQVRFLASVLQLIDNGKFSTTYRNLGRILNEVWGIRFHPSQLTKAIASVLHSRRYYEEDRESRKANILKKGFYGGKRSVI